MYCEKLTGNCRIEPGGLTDAATPNGRGPEFDKLCRKEGAETARRTVFASVARADDKTGENGISPGETLYSSPVESDTSVGGVRCDRGERRGLLGPRGDPRGDLGVVFPEPPPLDAASRAAPTLSTIVRCAERRRFAWDEVG